LVTPPGIEPGLPG